MPFAVPVPRWLPAAFACPICWTGANPFAIWLTKRTGIDPLNPSPGRHKACPYKKPKANLDPGPAG
jgi:hypothetical protein